MCVCVCVCVCDGELGLTGNVAAITITIISRPEYRADCSPSETAHGAGPVECGAGNKAIGQSRTQLDIV